MAVAEGLGAGGTSLADAAASAYTNAMALGFAGAAILTAVGAVLVARFLPPRQEEPAGADAHEVPEDLAA